MFTHSQINFGSHRIPGGGGWKGHCSPSTQFCSHHISALARGMKKTEVLLCQEVLLELLS